MNIVFIIELIKNKLSIKVKKEVVDLNKITTVSTYENTFIRLNWMYAM